MLRESAAVIGSAFEAADWNGGFVPTRQSAIAFLEANGHSEAAAHVRGWRNRNEGSGGWDANLAHEFPEAARLLWPEADGSSKGKQVPTDHRQPPEGSAARAHPTATSSNSVADLRLVDGAIPSFDAYCVVDWSAASTPATGENSIWCALLSWTGGEPSLEARNFPTRHALATELTTRLRGPLLEKRVLVGFDFPFGYPRGFAAAMGHGGSQESAWRTVWGTLREAIRDDARNANNRLELAASLNARVSGRFGPFFGRPTIVPPQVAAHLSPRQKGFFEFPLRTRGGGVLERTREVDRRGKTASTAWFVYGGANSVGGQALVGIPHVAHLREALPDARVWPFETGPMLPMASGARVVLAEVYPSLFHVRQVGGDIHDRLQVISTAVTFARLDAAGLLAGLFAAPARDAATLHEEGWILGVR